MAEDANFTELLKNYRHPADSPEGRATALKVMAAWFDRVHAKDLDSIATLMTEDVVVELPFNESGKTDQASYRIYRGIPAVLDFWATAFKHEGTIHPWEETDLTINSDGSRAFLEARGNLTMTNGRNYRNRYVMRFDFRDGKLSRCKEYYNPIQSAYGFGRPVAGKFMIEEL